MPFNSTKTIPLGWSEAHQPAAEGSFNARVVITDPSRTVPGEYDDDINDYGPNTPFPVAGHSTDTVVAWRAGVPCRIDHHLSQRTTEQGVEVIGVRSYLIQFPAALPMIDRGYRATVLSCPNDIELEGQTLTATDRVSGSERFNTDTFWTLSL